MKRVIIICEGPTEVEFCKELLYPHFLNLNITIQWALPEWSQGGNIAWGKLKKQIINTLKQDPTAIVTTFIDLYGLHNPELYPNWNVALAEKRDPYNRIALLEEGMLEEIPDYLRYRFIPNMILYEFEGLLFNDISHFENYYDDHEFKNKMELLHVLKIFPNPELINENKETSPSHRLKEQIFDNFSKSIDGILIALDIQLINIRKKSKHFDEWITKLENI